MNQIINGLLSRLVTKRREFITGCDMDEAESLKLPCFRLREVRPTSSSAALRIITHGPIAEIFFVITVCRTPVGG